MTVHVCEICFQEHAPASCCAGCPCGVTEIATMPPEAGGPDSAVFWAIGAGTSRVTVLRTYERDGRKRVTVQIEDGPCAGRVVAGVDPGELTGGSGA